MAKASTADDLTRHVRNDTRGLSEVSRRHYLSKLDTLVGRYGGTRTDDGSSPLVAVINEASRVIPSLQRDTDRKGRGAHAQTVHAYCSSVLALLDRLPPREAEEAGIRPSARDEWAACSRAASRATRRKYVNHMASDRQREGYVPWEDLVRRRELLEAEEENEGRPPSRGRLLLSMLTMAPPMRTSDLGSLRVLHVPRDLPALPTSVQEVEKSPVLSSGNHLVVGRRNRAAVLVMTEYKTAERYGRAEERRRKEKKHTTEKNKKGRDDGVAVLPFAQDRVLDGPVPVSSSSSATEGVLATRVRIGYLPDRLTAVVCESLAARPRTWLFEGERGRPFPLENSFNQMALRELRDLFDGRPLTVNLVRHAAVAWLDRQKPRDRELERYFQYWMMHTRDMQREYLLLRNLDADDFR